MSYELLGDEIEAIMGDDLDDLEELVSGEYDIMGDDDYDDDDPEVGYDDDDDDEVGFRLWPKRKKRKKKRSRRGKAARAAAKRSAMAKVMRKSTMYKKSEPTKANELALGFTSLAVGAGATANITSRPQVIFRPERLVIPSSIAANFIVDDIRIGKNSQFTAAGAIPAELFAENAVGVRLKMDTAQISQDIVLSVTNTSAGALDFYAGMIGSAIE